MIIASDHRIVREASQELAGSDVAHEIMTFRTGEEAVAFLEGRLAMEGETRRSFPDLVLFWFDSPAGNGRECLQKFKTSRDLRTLPILVFADSKMEVEFKALQEEKAIFFSKSLKPSDIRTNLEKAGFRI